MVFIFYLCNTPFISHEVITSWLARATHCGLLLEHNARVSYVPITRDDLKMLQVSWNLVERHYQPPTARVLDPIFELQLPTNN